MSRLNLFHTLNALNPNYLFQKQNEVWDRLEQQGNPLEYLSTLGEYASPAEVYRKDDKFLLLIPVSGFGKSDIDIQTSKNHISIMCTKPEAKPTEFKLIRGTPTNSLTFRESIPGTIDPDSIEATLENGILKIELSIAPKKEIANKIKIK